MMDINCDLGEGEPVERTRRLLRWVTSANIACGGHAGSVRTMRSCLRLCGRLGVNAGAHPGFADREGFGRKEMPISPSDLESLIEFQVGDLQLLANEEKIPIAHIKLHGALYHVVERDQRLSAAYAGFAKEHFPGIRIFASPNGCVVPAARRLGVEVWGEIFSDRAYTADGGLVPRGEPHALLGDLSKIKTRMEMFLSTGRVPLPNGKTVKIAAQTVCVHADSPGALRIARLLSRLCAAGAKKRP
ncbi:MAG TPA: 5-oxoprolinase subunit PxpA [Terrimicrobiaceae bacterium]